MSWLTVSQAEKQFGVEDAVLRHWVRRGCTAAGGLKIGRKARRNDGTLLVWGPDVKAAASAHAKFENVAPPEGTVPHWEIPKKFPAITAFKLWQWRPANDHWVKKRQGNRPSPHRCPYLENQRPLTVHYVPTRRGARVILGLYYVESELKSIADAIAQRGIVGKRPFPKSSLKPRLYKGKLYYPLALIREEAGNLTPFKKALDKFFDGVGPRWLLQQWGDAAIDKAKIPSDRKTSRWKREKAVAAADAKRLIDLLRKHANPTDSSMPAGLAPTPPTPPFVSPNHDRNAWIYTQRCQTPPVPWKLIIQKLNAIASTEGWEPLVAIESAIVAVKRHCENNGLPPPKPGKKGRPRKY